VEDLRALAEARYAGNGDQMGDELVYTNLEQVSLGCIGRWHCEEECFVPAKCPAPLADLRIGKIRADVVCEAIPDLANESQVAGYNFTDQPKAITGSHSASIRPKRSIRLQQLVYLVPIFNHEFDKGMAQ